MATTITRDVIESYLRCPYKGHLKTVGEQGTRSEYELLLAASREEAKRRACDIILARQAEGEVERNILLSPAALKRGAAFILNARLEDGDIALDFDGLKRLPGRSMLGNFHYAPVLFSPGRQGRKPQRAMLDVYGLLLAHLQGRRPSHGIVWEGKQCRRTRVRLTPNPRAAEHLLEELRKLRAADAPPRLVLNKHCRECEFRQRCRAAPVEKDNLSLLAGLSPKEVEEQGRKGIFTVTQFSYTFRPGRMKRVVEAGGRRHDPALQALAIRERTVYVTRRQPVPDAKVKVYLDVEGLPDPDHYYLIGLLVAEGDTCRRLSFWADRPAEEPAIWAAFLEALAGAGQDVALYHYGSYDACFLRRMAKRHGGDPGLLARIEARRVNVLSLTHGRVFFPVHENDLKSVAGYLGFHWSDPEPSGLQAIAWRLAWEATGDESLKRRLLDYNQDDCSALQRVVEVVRALGGDGSPGGAGAPTRVASVDDIKVPRTHKFCDPDYVLPAFNRITKCSYFDYQRDRVLFRTSPAVKKANRRKERRCRRAYKVNQVVEYGGPDRCPHCGSVLFGVRGHHSRLVVDLKPIGGGLKRWVTRHNAAGYCCRRCGGTWVPDGYHARLPIKCGRPPMFGRTLCGWAAYATVVLRQTTETTAEALTDLFGVVISRGEVSKLRSQAADFFRGTYDSLRAALRCGRLVHVDETWAKVKRANKRGYVWVFASPDTAVYVYSPTREGDTVRETLEGFKGVLVSDFYAVYDALDCPQQKCLVHLARDLNDDLVKRPFDEELKEQAGRFAALVQPIVEAIDRYGLKRRHLHKHKHDVERFFAVESAACYASESARHYRQRFLKYRGKLFTFLDHDGVPWNNNNAENAVKRFVSRRKVLGGTGAFTEAGFRDYLLLLSIYQTLRYRGASFWQFLVSGETDIDAFTASRR
jgi:predicted RecB family nuclease